MDEVQQTCFLSLRHLQGAARPDDWPRSLSLPRGRQDMLMTSVRLSDEKAWLIPRHGWIDFASRDGAAEGIFAPKALPGIRIQIGVLQRTTLAVALEHPIEPQAQRRLR